MTACATGRKMATALRQLPQQSLPSEVVVPGLLDGLEQRQPARPQQAARTRLAARASLAPRSQRKR